MTQDKLINKINKNGKFEFIKYIDSDNVLVRCKTCGSEEIKKISQITDIRCSCKACYYTRKQDNAKQYLIDRLIQLGSKFNLLKYSGKNSMATLQCSYCGAISQGLPSNIKRDNFSCSNKDCVNSKYLKVHEKRLSFNHISNEIDKLTNFEYSLDEPSTKHILFETKINIRHNICGNVFETTRGAFIFRNVRCPICKEKHKIDKLFNKAQHDLDLISNNRFVMDRSTFQNRRSVVTFYDSLYNEYFNMSYAYFIRKINNKIPKNAQHVASHTEEQIAKYLDDRNIIYTRQKTFTGMLSKRNKQLFMDFYIQKYNLCLEYDGEYHYLDIFGKNVLKSQRSNDREKNKYCKTNNINILRIPYWENKRIDEILNTLFNSLDNGTTFITAKRKIKISPNKLND